MLIWQWLTDVRSSYVFFVSPSFCSIWFTTVNYKYCIVLKVLSIFLEWQHQKLSKLYATKIDPEDYINSETNDFVLCEYFRDWFGSFDDLITSVSLLWMTALFHDWPTHITCIVVVVNVQQWSILELIILLAVRTGLRYAQRTLSSFRPPISYQVPFSMHGNARSQACVTSWNIRLWYNFRVWQTTVNTELLGLTSNRPTNET